MNRRTTDAIILARTDFGEADRILTVLTPADGKLRLMAKGVRRTKSKLAGGIELFSTSQLTYVKGRGEIGTLVSARLETHYGQIVKDINRTMLGYDLIKLLNKNTEDAPESDYFDMMLAGFSALDGQAPTELVRTWFQAQLLQLAGHAPNLRTDKAGQRLEADKRYTFLFDDMGFELAEAGQYGADEIKLLRLLFSETPPIVLAQVSGLQERLDVVAPVVQTITVTYLR